MKAQIATGIYRYFPAFQGPSGVSTSRKPWGRRPDLRLPACLRNDRRTSDRGCQARRFRDAGIAKHISINSFPVSDHFRGSCYTSGMIEITSSVKIEESEIQYDFIRASGPGGQNVNKVASSVQLRFDVRNSPSLEPDVKERLIKLAGSRVTEDGVLIIEAKRYRTQEQNREDAITRLVALVYQATQQPKPRKRTRPPAASQAERIEGKKRRGAIKRLRRMTPTDLE